MGVKVILHQHDLFSIRKVCIADLCQEMGVVRLPRCAVTLTWRAPSSGAKAIKMLAGVSETLCMGISPCGFGGSFVEPFIV